MLYFNLHTHHFTNKENVLELVNQYPGEFDATIPFYSIGIHPWHIVEGNVEKELEFIESKLLKKECLALGECGLDKRIEVPFDLQLSVFEKQLHLAEKYKRPVVIHCVAAFQEVIAIKIKLKLSIPMIIHGFSKNEQVAKGLLDNGFYLSFGKYLMRNPELAQVFENVPNERFFLETDTIEETIFEVYEKAKSIKGISIEDIVNSNFKKVFNL